MKTNRYKSEDVEYYTELNYDLNLWERLLGTGLTNNTLKELNVKLRKNMERRFSPQSKTYRSWPPLSPLTVKYKKSERRLFLTGKMSRSFKSTIYGRELVISNRAPQAAIHQMGGAIKTTEKQSFWLFHNVFDRKTHPFRPKLLIIPPRPFMGFDKNDIMVINKTIRTHLKKTERLGKYKL